MRALSATLLLLSTLSVAAESPKDLGLMIYGPITGASISLEVECGRNKETLVQSITNVVSIKHLMFKSKERIDGYTKLIPTTNTQISMVGDKILINNSFDLSPENDIYFGTLRQPLSEEFCSENKAHDVRLPVDNINTNLQISQSEIEGAPEKCTPSPLPGRYVGTKDIPVFSWLMDHHRPILELQKGYVSEPCEDEGTRRHGRRTQFEKMVNSWGWIQDLNMN